MFCRFVFLNWVVFAWFALAAATGLASSTDRPTLKLVFSCRAENDLYRVLTTDGVTYPRYDAPSEAVKAASEGSGLLILADGYPQKPTVVDPALLKTAAQKKLRVYIEYPAALPGLAVEKPRASVNEPRGISPMRAVVASDFFGDDLKPLRIIDLHGMYFTPAAADQSHIHIGAAQVGGVDTAVYGLPGTTYPLLFEYRGNALIATTKLSHFVTGRYMPYDAWQTVWTSVLRWLCPGKAVPELAWTPTVRPTYGRDEPLPPDYEKQAVKRGVEWYIKSKLLIHPSRADELHNAAFDERHLPTPAPDTPVGDGSHGIMEHQMSRIQIDGSQVIHCGLRCDCTNESAMALAFGGKVLNDPSKSAIAKNLLNFYHFTSDAHKREHGDPKHGAYGLFCWGIYATGYENQHYGDDNARAMLGNLAVAALTGDDRWDEVIMRCLLANLRTTGQLGFRGDTISLPELSQKGWRPFFERKIVDYWPHMEAYLWAAFLWAYEQTGYELFYERAENGLRMTMEQYTDGWRWTNGLAQEKARIVLPLAWLVRVKDTPEHRQWLMKAVDGLLALQQPCGAIREELGRPQSGSFPPPKSNDAYGSGEASLIQQNGDPISDLLYTTNFAFLGLHEAAVATGDPRIRQAEDKLAEFLCRIQIRSEAHPALDGGWYRVFDFRRWEAWGSNSDPGWGPWSIESGWTQGWITSVLALRQMKTSLWDLTKDSKTKRHFEKLREEMIPNDVIESLKPKTVKHATTGKKVTLAQPAGTVPTKGSEACPCLQSMPEGYVTTWGLSGAVIPAGTDAERPWLLDLDKAVGEDRSEIQLEAQILLKGGVSDKARDWMLDVGCTGAIQIVLNGDEVLESSSIQPLKSDQYRLKVRLHDGYNPMRLKLTRPSSGSWQASVRFRGADDGEASKVIPYVACKGDSSLGGPIAEVEFRKLPAIPIFDGKSFDGWEGNQSWFRVEQGAIVAGSLTRKVPQHCEYLMTKKQYGDFELALRARLIGSNSGIYFRCHRDPNSSEAHGYQLDMGRGVWGKLFDERATRTMGVEANLKKLGDKFDPNGWNDYRIRCVGPRIQFSLNGQMVIDYTELNHSIPRKGHIGLQLHGFGQEHTEAWFKDITVKEWCEQKVDRGNQS